MDDVGALLAVHELQRRAHLEGDAGLMGSVFGPTIREASGGETRVLTRDELEARFVGSFASRRYLEWSDTEPPVVKVAGTTAWMLVRVHARRTTPAGEPLPDFDAAWIAIYEKLEGEWKLVAISSSVVEGG